MTVKSTIDDFIWPNKLLLNIMGFLPRSPELSDIFRLFASFRIVLSFLAIFTLFIPEIFAIIHYKNDISKITDIGTVTIEVGQLVYKMFYVLIKRDNFKRIYKRAHDLWLVTDDEKEEENLKKFARLANQLTIGLFLAAIIDLVIFVFVSIIVSWNNYKQDNYTTYRVRYLPLEVWYGIDTQESPNYEIAVLCQTISMFYSAVGIVSIDATMMTLILHVSGQFHLISARFRDFGNDNEFESKSKVRMKIGRYIDHHKLVLSTAANMRELLGPVIFVQLMSSGLEICLCGYSLMVKGDSSIQIIKYMIYTVSMFLQLVLWCWPGEILIQESKAVGEILFQELPWYRLPADLQKDLSFVIMRSQKQCCVTALDFQIMSLSKLTEVFNTAASYFTLLRRVTLQ